MQSGGIIFAPLGYSVTNTRAEVGGARVIGRPQEASRDLGGQPCLQTLGGPGQAHRRAGAYSWAERGLSSLKQGALLRPGLARSQRALAIGPCTPVAAGGSGADRVRSAEGHFAALAELVPCLGWRAFRRVGGDLAGGSVPDRVIDPPPSPPYFVLGSLLPGSPCQLRPIGAERGAESAARRRSAPVPRPGVGRSSCRWCASRRLC